MPKPAPTEISTELAEAMNGACHCLSARKWARRLTRLYDEHLAAFGLTVGQFGIMTRIAYQGGTSLQELADVLDLDQSALSRGLAPLERDRFVVSGADPSDGRRRVLSLTEAGAQKLAAAAIGWKAAQTVAEQKIAARASKAAA